jgi:hypothetical protein
MKTLAFGTQNVSSFLCHNWAAGDSLSSLGRVVGYNWVSDELLSGCWTYLVVFDLVDGKLLWDKGIGSR